MAAAMVAAHSDAGSGRRWTSPAMAGTCTISNNDAMAAAATARAIHDLGRDRQDMIVTMARISTTSETVRARSGSNPAFMARAWKNIIATLTAAPTIPMTAQDHGP